IGTGGNALVSRIMGEGDRQRANEVFSMLVWASFAIGLVMTLLGIAFMRPIAILLGAEGEMLEYCVLYGNIMQTVMVAFVWQCEFQTFCVTAEKPRLGLAITVAAGLTNIALDALFVAAFRWGLVGAALASAISQLVGGIIPLVYFALPNSSALRLVKPKWNGRALLKACTNGSSEMVSNLSLSLVSMLYNLQLISFAGENGVAAYGVIMYVNFIFVGIFLGYSFGVAPVVGFHFGAANHDELKNLRRKSINIMGIGGLMLMVAAWLLSTPLSRLFVGYDAALMEMTRHGFRIYAIAFAFMGLNMFGSSFFTALNNGLISAILSFVRAFGFQVIAILILPGLFDVDGIWFSIVTAELLSLGMTVAFLSANQKRYHY
ncbi:MAG: MATE family efflux transporter, partial [Oscillospiraceae bacterium]|nr:MATE family efflux transporter [Oscillospiraceae bacterium]